MKNSANGVAYQPKSKSLNGSVGQQLGPWGGNAVAHKVWDDVYGIAVGILFLAIGINLLTYSGMISGGVAGVALLLYQVTGMTPGVSIPLVNIPFLLFGFIAMGRSFGIKTLIVSVALGSAIELVHRSVTMTAVSSGFAALGGGTVIGMGILCLARHNSSVGGVGAVAIWLQKRFSINVGLSALVFDIFLFACSTAVLPLQTVFWSVIGAVAMHTMLMVWHKPGRYFGGAG
jgi:uncharacterized membrane-anchored protein YitT (DUF2179 family)